MNTLGNYFNEDEKAKFAKSMIKPGAVVKVFTKKTEPPKFKRILIIGIDDNNNYLGCFFFNSKINLNVFTTQVQRDAQLLFSKTKSREYIDKDCYLDTSKLLEFNMIDIEKHVSDNPSCILGHLDENDYTSVRLSLKTNKFISNAMKKRFNIFPEFVGFDESRMNVLNINGLQTLKRRKRCFSYI